MPSAAGGARIEVDPDQLIGAGQLLCSVGEQLGMIADAAKPMLNGGIASGTDIAGLNFGFDYSDSARQLAPGVAAAANGCTSVGMRLQASGYNYANADARSTIGGSGSAGSLGEPPAETASASVPSGPNATIVPPPGLWGFVAHFFPPASQGWPSGDPAMMRLLAAQWENIARGLASFTGQIAGVQATASMQHIPEGAAMQQKLKDLGDNLGALADETATLPGAIRDFADEVQRTQDAIRRLLDDFSPGGMVRLVGGLFTGKTEEELRQIARDLRQELRNFGDQVEGLCGLIGQLTDVLGDAVTELQKLVRPYLVAAFGDDVGNTLASAFDYVSDFDVGVINGVLGTVSGTIAMLDPATWEGMYETVKSVAEDPSKLDDVLLDVGKGFIAYDQLTGDHPGRGVGEAALNVATLFMPGGALSKTGTVAKGLRYGSKLLDEGRLPRLSDVPLFKGGLTGLGDAGAGGRLTDIPGITPGAIPDSVVNGPRMPDRVDAPTMPRDFGGPAGSPGGPVSIPGDGGHGGGSGPPPAPPGHPVDPPNAAPSQPDASAGGQQASSGPVPSQSLSGPATPTDAPSAGGPSASSPQTPTDAPPPAHDPAGGERDSPRSQDAPGRDGVAETPTPVGDPADSPAGRHESAGDSTAERHESSSDSPGERLHSRDVGPAPAPATPEHHVSSHPSAAGHAPHDAAPDHRTGDSGQTQGTPERPGSGQQSMAAPMSGAPMGPVGAQHAPSGPGRVSAPEAPPRPPETSAPRSPESPRGREPSAAGPAPGSPTAPVEHEARRGPAETAKSVADQSVSAKMYEPAHRAPERPDDRTHESPRQGTATNPPDSDPSRAERPRQEPGDQRAHAPGTDPAHEPPHEPNDPNDPTDGADPPDDTPPLPGPPIAPAERVYGPHELDEVEDNAYQDAVEEALRGIDHNPLVHADPRTNDYGRILNDGGPEVPGRSNNCLDCSLSALSSFYGHPAVSAPRFLDKLPDGSIDKQSGERGGLTRAENWLGGGMLHFEGMSLGDQFRALHDYIGGLGPGSAALVHNGWHAQDLRTGELLHHADGTPVTRGSHATVIVYPHGAEGPVWWDPQTGIADGRPSRLMFDRSTFLEFTPIDPHGGGHHGGAADHGAGAGLPGADVAQSALPRGEVPAGLGVHEDPDPRADRSGSGAGPGAPGDRLADRNHLPVSELVGDGGGRGVHGIQGDRDQPGRPADLPLPVEDHDSTVPGGRPDDRLPTDDGITESAARADSEPFAHDQQAHIDGRSEGLSVESGAVARGVDHPPESGDLAPDGHDGGLADGRDEGGGERPSTEPTGTEAGNDPVHSRDDAGDGWHRIGDKEIDPNYGQPLPEHWPSEGYPTPNDYNRSTFDLIKNPDEPWGHDEAGNPLTQAEYDERYNLIGPKGDHWQAYPPNDGAVPGTRVIYDSGDAFIRDYGLHLDRIGEDTGTYLGVMPDGVAPSFEDRGLPIASLELPHKTFSLQFLPEGWQIEVSEIAPAFGRDGGALQLRVYNSIGQISSIEEMLEVGALN